jgi:PIN domain nuclease of toxin-antitoxin system
MSDAILLDTHVAIWLTFGRLHEAARRKLAFAVLGDGVLISPIVAWEVGLIAGPSGRPEALGFDADVRRWYSALLAEPGFRECALDGAIALSSTMLPGEFHKDPADRFLVATARALNCSLMTRDRKILDYAAQGHLKTISC